jgi:RNA polymerase sigma-70 factor (ECF subfamily)
LHHLEIAHGPVLRSYVTRLTGGDTEAAESIVQATLARARTDPDARDEDGRWRRGWLFTEAARRLGRAGATDPPIDAAQIRAALAGLPESLRSTLVEVYFRARPVSEVAELLGVPEHTVASRTYYGLRALRAALHERGIELS